MKPNTHALLTALAFAAAPSVYADAPTNPPADPTADVAPATPPVSPIESPDHDPMAGLLSADAALAVLLAPPDPLAGYALAPEHATSADGLALNVQWASDRSADDPSVLLLALHTAMVGDAASYRVSVNGGAWLSIEPLQSSIALEAAQATPSGQGFLMALEARAFAGIDRIEVRLMRVAPDGAVSLAEPFVTERRARPSEPPAEEIYDLDDTPLPAGPDPVLLEPAEVDDYANTLELDPPTAAPAPVPAVSSNTNSGATNSGGGGVSVSGGGGGGGGGGAPPPAPPRAGNGGSIGSASGSASPAPQVTAPDSGSTATTLNATQSGVYGQVIGSVIVLSGVDAVSWTGGNNVKVLYGEPTVGDLAIPPTGTAANTDLIPYLGGAAFSAIPEIIRANPSGYIVLQAAPGQVQLRLWSKAPSGLAPLRNLIDWDASVTQTYDPSILRD